MTITQQQLRQRLERVTPQQMQVLIGVSQGKTYREIGDELGLTASGVIARALRLRTLFGAQTIAHMVAIAYTVGLLRVPVWTLRRQLDAEQRADNARHIHDIRFDRAEDYAS